ncbi:GNAT family N-acetyltransferase [Promicromonospora sp. Populi]|uniref:GNAT family N-acetyltransferase n=1 Tax=Promicromonospora sp. Populi TaxID=3239420 RepID=UPI0034E226B3
MSSPTSHLTWRILEVPAVPSAEHPDAWAYHGIVAVDQAVELATRGYDDLANTLQQTVSGMLHQEYSDKQRFVAVLDRADGGAPTADDVVGYGFLAMTREHNTHTADVYVGVHPDHQRQGIGTALADRAEQAAADAGRTTFFAWSPSPREAADGEEALVPATGVGRLPPPQRVALSSRFAAGTRSSRWSACRGSTCRWTPRGWRRSRPRRGRRPATTTGHTRGKASRRTGTRATRSS